MVLVTLKSNKKTTLPLPLKEIVEGAPAALWRMDREVDFAPAETGANVTVIVWPPPEAIVAVVGDTVNCEASVPVNIIPATDKLALPVLLIVNVFCDVAPTFVLSIASEVVERLIAGAGEGGVAVPLPVSETDDGLPDAL